MDQKRIWTLAFGALILLIIFYQCKTAVKSSKIELQKNQSEPFIWYFVKSECPSTILPMDRNLLADSISFFNDTLIFYKKRNIEKKLISKILKSRERNTNYLLLFKDHSNQGIYLNQEDQKIYLGEDLNIDCKYQFKANTKTFQSLQNYLDQK